MQREQTAIFQSLCELTDIAIAGTTLIAVFAVANLGVTLGGMEAFMKSRVTIPNVILGAAFLLLWHFLFHLFGVYEASLSRSVPPGGAANLRGVLSGQRLRTPIPVDQPQPCIYMVGSPLLLAGSDRGGNRFPRRPPCAA